MGVILFFLVGLVVYLLPIFVAANRGHKSSGGIAVVNIFLGWTFLGWVVALAWAFSGEAKQRMPAGVTHPTQPPPPPVLIDR